MALTCPNCEILNRCECKNCNPDKNPKDLVIIDYDNSCYQCYSCGHKFNEQDSLDFEWDRMHENIKKSITPEMCIIWKSLGYKEQKEYSKLSANGQYGFESAFFQHFGIRANDCGHEQFTKIKLMVERENKIQKLIQTNI